MKRMYVTVTKEMVDESLLLAGSSLRSQTCPIAQAIKAKGNTRPTVGYEEVHCIDSNGEYFSGALSKRGLEFIKAFDDNQASKYLDMLPLRIAIASRW